MEIGFARASAQTGEGLAVEANSPHLTSKDEGGERTFRKAAVREAVSQVGESRCERHCSPDGEDLRLLKSARVGNVCSILAGPHDGMWGDPDSSASIEVHDDGGKVGKEGVGVVVGVTQRSVCNCPRTVDDGR